MQRLLDIGSSRIVGDWSRHVGHAAISDAYRVRTARGCKRYVPGFVGGRDPILKIETISRLIPVDETSRALPEISGQPAHARSKRIDQPRDIAGRSRTFPKTVTHHEQRL